MRILAFILIGIGGVVALGSYWKPFQPPRPKPGPEVRSSPEEIVREMLEYYRAGDLEGATRLVPNLHEGVFMAHEYKTADLATVVREPDRDEYPRSSVKFKIGDGQWRSMHVYERDGSWSVSPNR